MTQDLQFLLEKINADGVEKAKAEAEQIVGAAHARAKAILDAAKHDAEQTLAAAKQEAETFRQQAVNSVRQAARDTLLSVKQDVTAMLTTLLLEEVNATMCNSDRVAALAEEAVRAYLAGNDSGGIADIATSAALLDVLRAKLAHMARDGVTVVTDERTGSGFKVHLAGGHVEHDFTGAAVAAALARGLHPRLAALLD